MVTIGPALAGASALLPLDYVVIVVYVVGLTALGVYFGRQKQSTKGYFLGDRSLPWWAVMLSIVATETSAATVIGAPAYVYPKGTMLFFQVTLGYLVARLVIAILFVPRFHLQKGLSIYEYLEGRFGPNAKVIAALTYFVTRVLATGIRVYIPAIVIQEIIGISFHTAVIVSVIVALIYTTFGGFKAVVWTDAIQFVIYLAGGVAGIWVVASRLDGGLGEIFQVGGERGLLQLFDWSAPDGIKASVGGIFGPGGLMSEAYWSPAAILGGMFLSMATHGTDQSIGQRLIACPTARGSKAAIIGSGVLVIPQFLLFMFVGVALVVFYAKVGDVQRFDAEGRPLAVEQRVPGLYPEDNIIEVVQEKPAATTEEGRAALPTSEPHEVLRKAFTRSDRVFPYFAAHEMPAGLIGLIFAAILAAAMSTASADMNSLAAVSVNDFYRRVKPHADDTHYMKASRVFTVVWGILICFVAYIPKMAPPEIKFLDICLAIPSLTFGALLGTFLLGFLTKRTNEPGVITGAAVGALVIFFLGFLPNVALWFPGVPMPTFVKKISVGWTWYAPIGTLVTMAVGYLASIWIFPWHRPPAGAEDYRHPEEP